MMFGCCCSRQSMVSYHYCMSGIWYDCHGPADLVTYLSFIASIVIDYWLQMKNFAAIVMTFSSVSSTSVIVKPRVITVFNRYHPYAP